MKWYIISIAFVCLIGATFGFLDENKRIQTVTALHGSPLVPPHLLEAARQLKQISLKKVSDETTCRLCQQFINGIISLRRSNNTRDEMMDYFNSLCNYLTDWGTEVCKGNVDVKTDVALYIIDHKEDLTPARFCAIQFQLYGCQDPDADDWSIPLPAVPDDVSKVAPAKHYRPVINKNDAESVHILQITDVHIDALYTPESNSKCSEPLCCQSGTPATLDDAAGYWGDYDVCDMPLHTMQGMLGVIKKEHTNLDWIYFTGDIISHRFWDTSVQGNTEAIKLFLALLADTFPGKTVFPVFGNHEAHPVDCYSPDGIDKSANVSTQWLLDLAAEQWSRWLPNDTQTTIQRGGFYTVLVTPGFRIVALNSNVCFTTNLWLVYENKDTFGQLQWLVDVLTEAEKNGEKVHILSHIPPSDTDASCVKVWSREYNKIVLRFSDTITAQFNGHTHSDELKLFYSSCDGEEVKAVGYNGASFTTFIGNNPNYRIYDVDNSNMIVTDYHEYIFNLTKANLNSQSAPEWYKLYSFKEAYGLPDLTMKSLGDLYTRMASNNSDNELVDKYFRYTSRDSDVATQQGCDSACKKRIVCLIGATETSQSIIYC